MKVNYNFNLRSGTDSIVDETGNGYTAKLMGSAKTKKLGKYSVLQIGADNGYVDLGAKIGEVIGSLSTFTISTYLYIDNATVLTNAGNFVWTFSNSANISTSAKGCMFYSAKESRYAITATDYSAEKVASIASPAAKGSWKHVTVTQSATTATVYIDGVSKKTSKISLLPTTLGATTYNSLGKSAYASDQILFNSMMTDFRVYNTVLTATQVAALATNIASLDTLTFTDQVQTAAANFSLGNISGVTSDIALPTDGGSGVTISWSSANTAVISNAGVVTRPASGSDTARVVLTATFTKNFVSKQRNFTVSVAPFFNDQTSVKTDADSLKLKGNLTNLRSNLTLPTAGVQGTTITWNSNAASVLSNTGTIVTRPKKGSGKALVTLTATISKGTVSSQKSFNVSVAEDEGFAGYLFAYFTGNAIAQEAIRFATSPDAYTYTALNNDQPVVNSAMISTTGGVRDPHILRGESNNYLMVATDMVSANGWNSNRAMVLLKSTNLVDWISTVVNIPNTYPEYSAADRVWAPQTIYDPKVGKYMIYFAMRLGASDYDKIYYAYANSNFTALEAAPKVLFNNNGLSTIDSDIIFKDGQYHLFFKTEGNGNGIKKAVSSSLTSGYVLLDKYLDQNANGVEGGCVFRLYNSDNYILMYDVYSSGYYEFTKSTDLENFTVINNAISMNFTPRHGTVIPITSTELYNLNAQWNPSSVSTNKANQQFRAYSENKQLHLIFDNSGSMAKATIMDVTGKKLTTSAVSSINNTIDISFLQKGVYLLNCTTSTGEIGSTRFVVR